MPATWCCSAADAAKTAAAAEARRAAATLTRAAPANSTPLPRAPPKSPTTTFPSENKFYVFVSINPVLLQSGGRAASPHPHFFRIEVFRSALLSPCQAWRADAKVQFIADSRKRIRRL